MSHLFKNDLSIYFKIFKILIILLFYFSTFMVIKVIEIKLHTQFFIVSNYLLIFAFRKKAIF